ncbi:uncharacterized protein [Amphiura filiformis]|uniref:uncharacterized protein n=1 Tax=Amphiura filiformis TaxID=82378 RepID=UPI003B21DAF0
MMAFYQDKLIMHSMLSWLPVLLLLQGNYAQDSNYNCECVCQKTGAAPDPASLISPDPECPQYPEQVSFIPGNFSPQIHGCDVGPLARCATNSYTSFTTYDSFTTCQDNHWSCCQLQDKMYESIACFTSDVSREVELRNGICTTDDGHVVQQSCYGLYCKCTSVSVTTPSTKTTKAQTSLPTSRSTSASVNTPSPSTQAMKVHTSPSSFTKSKPMLPSMEATQSVSPVTMATTRLRQTIDHQMKYKLILLKPEQCFIRWFTNFQFQVPGTSDSTQSVVIGASIGATILVIIAIALLVYYLCHKQDEKKPDINQDQQERRSRKDSDKEDYEKMTDLKNNRKQAQPTDLKSQVTVANETQSSVLSSSGDDGYVECRPIPNASSVNPPPPPLPQGNPSQDTEGVYGNQRVINQRNQRLGKN